MSNQNVPRTLSLSEAAALLRMHKNTLQERARTGPVFLFRGKPISSVKTAFMAACIRAQVGRYEAGGYQGFTWHGLRHTWATWHVQNGTPLDVLQKLGGWSDLRMVMNYAHHTQPSGWVRRQQQEEDMTTHTLRALIRYDRMKPKLDARWGKVSTEAGVAALAAAQHRELVLVQLAFYRDTHRINSLENCLRVIDIEFMRSTGHLNIRPKKVKK